MFSETKKNKMAASRWFLPITLGWFVLSVFFGWLSSLVFKPFGVLYIIYANYQSYVIKYDLFCLSVLCSFVLLPCAVFFYWEKGFCEIDINKNKWLAFSIVLALGVCAAFMPPTLQSSGKYTNLVRVILAEFDWLGAFLIGFIGLYLVALALVMTFLPSKNIEEKNM